MRRKHSALARIEADIKAGALAGARRAAKKALNETRLALTPVEFDEVVRRAMEELRREVAREFDVRDRRITNALAELIPLPWTRCEALHVALVNAIQCLCA